MKIVQIILVLLLAFNFSTAQKKSINNYKYVIIPIQFDFLKGKDTYRLNTLTKYLFVKEGFEAYFDEQKLPADLFENRCLALYADVQNLKGGIFKTKVQISLKDCYGEEVMVSDVGESREKDYKKAYTEAINNAFVSFTGLKYEYIPLNLANSSAKSDNPVVVEVKESETKELAAKEVITPQISIEDDNHNPEVSTNATSSLLKVKPIALGYEILNDSGELVMVLLATSSNDVYIVQGKSAIVYKTSNGNYMYSENDGSSIIQKPVKIKL